MTLLKLVFWANVLQFTGACFGNQQKSMDSGAICLRGAGNLNKLVVVGGVSTAHFKKSNLPVEVLDLENPTRSCQDMEQSSLDLDLMEASGGLLTDAYNKDIEWTPIVCGGYSNANRDYSNKCFTPGNSSTVAVMEHKRAMAASIVVGSSRLWITGGWNGQERSLKSSEFIGLSGATASGFQQSFGPDLPLPVYGHCLVSIGQSKAMLIGGIGNKVGTWIYDTVNGFWSSGPDLKEERWRHSCASITDTLDGSTIVVVVGGGDYPGSLSTVELWTMDLPIWIKGPSLPFPVTGSTGFTSPDGKSFILAGGISPVKNVTNLYRFGCANRRCQWIKMEQTLTEPRFKAVGFVVPDSLTCC